MGKGIGRGTLHVSAERFSDEDFPMVCILSGRPADTLVQLEANTGPIWPVFLAGGWLAAYFADAVAARVTGSVPVNEAVFDAYDRMLSTGFRNALFGLMLLISGTVGWGRIWQADPWSVVAVVTAVLLVGGAALFAEGVTRGLRGAPGRLRVRLSPDASSVSIAPVHPTFLAALERHVGAAQIAPVTGQGDEPHGSPT